MIVQLLGAALFLDGMRSATGFALGHSRVPLSLVRAPPVTLFEDGGFDAEFAELITNATTSDWEFMGGLSSLRAPGRSAFAALHALGDASSDLALAESDDMYKATLTVPGVDAGDVDVSVEDGMLTISGSRTEELWGGAHGTSRFSVSRSLPADADPDLYSLTHADDLLTIELPKAALLPEGEEESGEGDMASLLAEAEAMAKESPRFARWLRANGYLTDNADDQSSDDVEEVELEEVEEAPPAIGE